MEWTDFWRGIQYIFEEILFAPLNWLRDLQLDSWWGANIISWIFLLTAAAGFIYWMKQLKGFHDEEMENASHSEH